MTTIYDIKNIRKNKIDLYFSLLRKGLNNLTNNEKRLLQNLSVDDDIKLILKNELIFQEL